jgi:hypothetical protein
MNSEEWECGDDSQCFVYGIRTVLILVDFYGKRNFDCRLDMVEVWHGGDCFGIRCRAKLKKGLVRTPIFPPLSLWRPFLGARLRGFDLANCCIYRITEMTTIGRLCLPKFLGKKERSPDKKVTSNRGRTQFVSIEF